MWISKGESPPQARKNAILGTQNVDFQGGNGQNVPILVKILEIRNPPLIWPRFCAKGGGFSAIYLLISFPCSFGTRTATFEGIGTGSGRLGAASAHTFTKPAISKCQFATRFCETMFSRYICEIRAEMCQNVQGSRRLQSLE